MSSPAPTATSEAATNEETDEHEALAGDLGDGVDESTTADSTPADNDDDDDESDTAESPAEHDEGDTDATPSSVETPQPIVLSGIIQGLAASLAVKGTLLLAIAKLSDQEILVTIQPTPAEKESHAAAIPLQVAGSPAEIDANLVSALAQYVPARTLSIATAEAIAQQTAQAAAKAKDDAARRAEAYKPKPKTGRLRVNVDQKDATLVVTDAAGKTYPVDIRKQSILPVGKYTISVAKEYHDTHTEVVTVGSTPTTIDVTLKQSALTLGIS